MKYVHALLLPIGALALSACSITSEQPVQAPSQSTSRTMSDAMVMTVTADLQQRESPVSFASRLAMQPDVARVMLRERDQTRMSAVLVFNDRADFLTWQETQSGRFWTELGNSAKIRSVTVSDRRLLDMAGLGRAGMLPENVSVTYENTGETADGDADIDAVTVICSDGAICEPSN